MRNVYTSETRLFANAGFIRIGRRAPDEHDSQAHGVAGVVHFLDLADGLKPVRRRGIDHMHTRVRILCDTSQLPASIQDLHDVVRPHFISCVLLQVVQEGNAFFGSLPQVYADLGVLAAPSIGLIFVGKLENSALKLRWQEQSTSEAELPALVPDLRKQLEHVEGPGLGVDRHSIHEECRARPRKLLHDGRAHVPLHLRPQLLRDGHGADGLRHGREVLGDVHGRTEGIVRGHDPGRCL
mmetsp:Transcript_4276/g.16740  ORF Transcript_4276/g.16740 Transcript_4276/m.16740 type:complete len:239 (-) Transcript_4276:140-856(-)|eukprot:scaffold8485_cov277-Pinguiococcus_pyrenoidosus.AAC.9